MGKPKFSRKKYETPSHPWQEDRIKAENELIKKYGLKNKREIWKAETTLRRYRGQARELLARIGSDNPQVKRESEQLLMHLTRYNILPLNSTLDDVLALDTEAILARRLQTLTYLKGFANTPKHARQLISHGHIAIDGRKITVPGYRVTKDEESKISYVTGSPLTDPAHPARPTSDFSTSISKKLAELEKTEGEKPAPAAEEKKETTKQVASEKTKEPEQKPVEKQEVKKEEQTSEETKEQTAAEEQTTKETEEGSEQKSDENQPSDEKQPGGS